MAGGGGQPRLVLLPAAQDYLSSPGAAHHSPNIHSLKIIVLRRVYVRSQTLELDFSVVGSAVHSQVSSGTAGSREPTIG